MLKTDIMIPLIDENDNIIGHGEKLDVHIKGLRHRAFSILVYNEKAELLIHQRALHKYHSAGLWTNTCCGHPNQGEPMLDAVHRRLMEEMGFFCNLTHQFTFQYHAAFENGLIENEIDHVYVGKYDGDFTVNPDEVADYKWLSIENIKELVQSNPESFTVWFKVILEKL